MEVGKDWVEAILKRNAYEDSPVQVLEVVPNDPGLGKGENYMSQTERIKAKVLLGSGKVKTMYFFLKKELESRHLKRFSAESGVFIREITMYRDVLPKMQELLEEIGDPDGTFWAKCYDVRLYNRLLFEDLSVKGYKMADRRKQLGLDATLLVMRQLAKFHALSRILLDRGEIPVDVFSRHMFFKNREDSIIKMSFNVKQLISAMENWGEEWKERILRFKKAENFAERVIDASQVSPDDFTVLSHGDCWTNNLLFSGDDLEHPTSVKLIDLQMVSTNSPIWDIAYFFATSVRPDVLEKNWDDLLKAYSDVLQSCLAKFSYGGVIPDYQFIKNEFKKKETLLVSFGISVVPWMLTTENNFLNLEEVFEKQEQLKKTGRVSEGTHVLETLDAVGKNVIQNLIRRAVDLEIV